MIWGYKDRSYEVRLNRSRLTKLERRKIRDLVEAYKVITENGWSGKGYPSLHQTPQLAAIDINKLKIQTNIRTEFFSAS